MNQTLTRISIGLLFLAILLTFISFALINNTVRLSIYSKRFSIRTMKLVGASWRFIRRPFMVNAFVVGLIASLLACAVIGGGVYTLYLNEPNAMEVLTWKELAITAAIIFGLGTLLTTICARISVNKYLKMKADELYKI